MQAGKLRHRVELQRFIKQQDASTGEVAKQWQRVAIVWASVEPVSGKEFMEADTKQGQIQARIVMRERAVDEAMRVIYRGKKYNINAVLSDRKSGREYVTLMVSEGTNDG